MLRRLDVREQIDTDRPDTPTRDDGFANPEVSADKNPDVANSIAVFLMLLG